MLRMLFLTVNHCIRHPPTKHLRPQMLHQHQLRPDAILFVGFGDDVFHRSQSIEVSASSELKFNSHIFLDQRSCCNLMQSLKYVMK